MFACYRMNSNTIVLWNTSAEFITKARSLKTAADVKVETRSSGMVFVCIDWLTQLLVLVLLSRLLLVLVTLVRLLLGITELLTCSVTRSFFGQLSIYYTGNAGGASLPVAIALANSWSCCTEGFRIRIYLDWVRLRLSLFDSPPLLSSCARFMLPQPLLLPPPPP